tara:strand:- start:191 stop:562 length:372 start_codon:yes stop_codon:yes gene_type:complete
MKNFKQFLEEASNAIKKLHPWATKLVGKGGYNDDKGEWYYKTTRELFKKSKLSDKDKKDYDKYNNPGKPPEKPIDPYSIPVKKAMGKKQFGKNSKINPKVLERPETIDKNRDNTNPIIKKIKA